MPVSYQTKFAIIDVETSGGKSGEDRITELAIFLHNGNRIIESFSSLVNPQRKIDPFVVALTGINDQMVAEAPLFEELAPKILEITQDAIFVAHNVRFDYGMFRKEFRRININFVRKQLCTVQLSRKSFPGFKSYGLGNLCQSLDIQVVNRHRAAGDAEATVILFEKMLKNDRGEIIWKELNEGIDEHLLPGKINKDDVINLPEEAGVYYFKDEKGKIIYIGKSNNIKKRVKSHFSADIKERRFAQMKEKMAELDYELTGNELIALLKEANEIKRFMPEFNRAQRRKKYRYGLFLRTEDNGLKLLQIDLLNDKESPVLKLTTKRMAERMLDSLDADGLIKSCKMLMGRIKDEGKRKAFIESFNQKLDERVKKYYFAHPNFFIVGTSAEPDMKTLVWVENYIYKGYGNVLIETLNHNRLELLKEAIKPMYDEPDTRSIIRKWMQKNRCQLIRY